MEETSTMISSYPSVVKDTFLSPQTLATQSSRPRQTRQKFANFVIAPIDAFIGQYVRQHGASAKKLPFARKMSSNDTDRLQALKTAIVKYAANLDPIQDDDTIFDTLYASFPSDVPKRPTTNQRKKELIIKTVKTIKKNIDQLLKQLQPQISLQEFIIEAISDINTRIPALAKSSILFQRLVRARDVERRRAMIEFLSRLRKALEKEKLYNQKIMNEIKSILKIHNVILNTSEIDRILDISEIDRILDVYKPGQDATDEQIFQAAQQQRARQQQGKSVRG